MNTTFGRSSRHGFTLVGLLVILAVIAILAAMLLPALASAKGKAQRINCVNNLKQCGLAFRIWEGDQSDRYPMGVSTNQGGTKELDTGANTFRHFQVMSNELSTPRILICPSDTRMAADNFIRLKNQNVSYFVSLVATDEYPDRFLDGDRNITGPKEPENGILKLSPGQTAGWTATMHVNQGNVGLADGSVWQYSSAPLTKLLSETGAKTNIWRISLPE
jgi:type II secretory pathway pseudopilin PulG